MIQKGVYPYDHIDSYDKIYVDKLPSQIDFYGVLSKNVVMKIMKKLKSN